MIKRSISTIIVICLIGASLIPCIAAYDEDIDDFTPIADSWASEANPDSTPGAADSLRTRGQTAWRSYVLLQFDLSTLPSGLILQSAKLYLYYYDNYDGNPSGNILSIHKILGSWNEGTISWNTQPSHDSTITDESIVPSSPGIWLEWDVTSDVQSFINGVNTNYGWKIIDTDTSSNDIAYFRSKEYGSNIPYLEIQYTVNTPPIPDADGPYNADVGENITFDGSLSADPDGHILQYTWEFGDGSLGFGINPTHTYTNAGDYTVRLTVKDNNGAEETDTTMAYINTPPTADANGPYTGERSTSITLDGSNSSDIDGTIELYEWDLDSDGEYDDGEGETTVYSWSEGGTHTIGLKVTDDDGSTDTDETTITISNQAPETPATPTGPTQGKINEEQTFTTTTNEPDEDQIWYKWNWGDGTESEWLGPYNDGELCTASHTWTTEDLFDIKVKARDNGQMESDWSDPLTVSMPKYRYNHPFFEFILYLISGLRNIFV